MSSGWPKRQIGVWRRNGAEPLSVLLDYPPTFRVLQVCGAAGSALTCDAVWSASTTAYQLVIVADPETTQTIVPTPTPTPTFPIRYRLIEGSTIAFRPPTPGAALASEPLSGTFTVLRCLEPPPNTVLFTITGMELASASFSVTGGSPQSVECRGQMGIGSIDALTLDQDVYFFAVVSIDGQPVGLGGSGPIDYDNRLPTYQNFEVCGYGTDHAVSCEAIRSGTEGGYALTLFAVPDD